jgi:hypothetical protein
LEGSTKKNDTSFSPISTPSLLNFLNLRNSCFLIRLPLLSLRLSGSIVIRRTLS